MADTIRNLLWHAGPSLGADILARLGAPLTPSRAVYGSARDRGNEHVPPALAEHALRVGGVDVFLGLNRRYGSARQPADVDVLLRLLEHDDPEINASLFRQSSWPALRQAVMSQRRFAPDPDPEVADLPVPLNPALRESILAQGSRGDLQAALSAVDPDLVFFALVTGVVGGAHGGPQARIRAFTTLAKAGRRAQLRLVLQAAPPELPPDAPPELEQELRGAKPYDLVDKLLDAEYSTATFCARLRDARRTAHGRGVVRGVLEPPWAEVEHQHAVDPLPWGAAVALLEHPRCPASLRAALLRTHPRAVQSVARPGHEVLAVCQAMGEDQLTKKVLLRGIDSNTIGPDELVTAVRPARIALTALVHGGLGAVATQGAATRLVRTLLLARITQDPGAWRELYTALPGFTGTAAELLAGASQADADGPPGADTGTDTDTGPGTGTGPGASSAPQPLPVLGRQSAWAYTALIDIAGPEHAGSALGFLDDARLAPPAGSRELPQSLADHVMAHGGPIARRVLAQNAAIRVDLLEELARDGDPSVASSAYRNPRCPLALRRAILASDTGIDAGLRAELLAEQRAGELWPLLASRDAALLRHLVFAWTGEFERAPRLRAAYRLAALHGIDALRDLPDVPEIAKARRKRSLRVLRDRVAAYDAAWLDLLRKTPYIPYRREPDGIHGALADPGLNWREVTDAVRHGEIPGNVLNALARRPDHPVELARRRRDTHRQAHVEGAVNCRDVAWHRSLVTDCLGPSSTDASTTSRPTEPPPGTPPNSTPSAPRTPPTGIGPNPPNLPADVSTAYPADSPARGPLRWTEVTCALDTGALTVAEFVATGDAATVINVSADHVLVARAVSRILHDTLGDSADAWVVLAHLVRQRTPATLAEVAATARAAA